MSFWEDKNNSSTYIMIFRARKFNNQQIYCHILIFYAVYSLKGLKKEENVNH